MDDATLERWAAEARAERQTQVRPIEVRRPAARNERYSGGVEMEIPSGQMSTVVDLNRFELRVWARSMLALADQLDAEEMVGMLQAASVSHARAVELARIAYGDEVEL